ncbi:putative nucleic acid binding protein [Paratrimastix pyriformis]|uniref:Nucleic acid binding protein n=1 Tax=Paratrimastix pyriformis TaxID=342808 RepID=A0ABQ8UKV9_9EUKA|nr:putative nucleic acid binding protein [Paratrimastix pyriformis]
MTEEKPNRFLKTNPENGDFNQYWYSEKTIATIVAEVEAQGASKVACISCPSIYFSLPQSIRDSSFVFDFDDKWARDRGFVHYDFRCPEQLPASLLHTFDFLVIDPPFITRDVWTKYAEAVRLLAKDGAKILCSSIAENAAMLKEMVDVSPVTFMPSIPHLVYQYNFYTNFPPTVLRESNPEIPM